ncbi:glycosyltransferase 87 family protein [Dietzia psychralcaliphila]|uniref:glycosyltransferase 87 family protein n=1 Tax=Dietzia psychralcaliphila TaxID=139021 RepID=UPI001C1E8A0C|nr:glycosyltransferase 87 family protein [Dietzia psychralcaliphila]
MSRPTTTTRGLSVAAGLTLSVAVTVVVMTQAVTGFMLDLQVFQDAGKAMLAGRDLYSEDFPTRSGFRFIYPPFAAIAFIPLAPLAATAAQVAWTAATIAAVWAILAMVATRLRLHGAMALALALTGVALLLEPIRANLGFGQINVFLVLMVTADVLGFTPRRVRGVLVGLAAGVKLTPAAFALMFLARKDWASLVRALGAAVTTIVLGHLVRPADSAYFWTTEFFLTDRGGPPEFVPNQALSGLLARAGLSGAPLDLAVYGFFLLTAAAAAWGAWLLIRDDRPVDALMLVSLGVFIASPVAVTHHWSGMFIALPLLLASRRLPVRLALAALVVAHLIGTHLAYSLTPLDPAAHLLQWLVGNAQGLTGIAAFGILLADAARQPTPTRPDPEDPDA